MRANRVINTYDVQISLRLPVEGEIKVAGENLPLRPIVKLDDVALGVRSDLHRPGALILASRDLRRVSPATTSLSASVWPEAIKPNMHSVSVVPGLHNFGLIPTSQVLIDAHRPFYGRWRKHLFDRVM